MTEYARYYPDGKLISIDDFYYDVDWDYDWSAGVIGIGNNEEAKPSFFIRNSKNKETVQYKDWVWVEVSKNGNNKNPNVVFTSNELKTKDDWGCVRAPELDGKCIPESDFEKSLWYYIPEISKYYSCGGPNGHGGFTMKHESGEINNSNIHAQWLEYSEDTGTYDKILVGDIKINVSHGNKTDHITYPVYLEKRMCLCTFNPDENNN